MSNVIGGKVFVAPNGLAKCRVFRHGFVKPLTEEAADNIDIIQEMSLMAMDMPDVRNNPFNAFIKMGWTEEKESPAPVGEKEKAE